MDNKWPTVTLTCKVKQNPSKNECQTVKLDITQIFIFQENWLHREMSNGNQTFICAQKRFTWQLSCSTDCFTLTSSHIWAVTELGKWRKIGLAVSTLPGGGKTHFWQIHKKPKPFSRLDRTSQHNLSVTQQETVTRKQEAMPRQKQAWSFGDVKCAQVNIMAKDATPSTEVHHCCSIHSNLMSCLSVDRWHVSDSWTLWGAQLTPPHLRGTPFRQTNTHLTLQDAPRPDHSAGNMRLQACCWLDMANGDLLVNLPLLDSDCSIGMDTQSRKGVNPSWQQLVRWWVMIIDANIVTNSALLLNVLLVFVHWMIISLQLLIHRNGRNICDKGNIHVHALSEHWRSWHHFLWRSVGHTEKHNWQWQKNHWLTLSIALHCSLWHNSSWDLASDIERRLDNHIGSGSERRNAAIIEGECQDSHLMLVQLHHKLWLLSHTFQSGTLNTNATF